MMSSFSNLFIPTPPRLSDASLVFRISELISFPCFRRADIWESGHLFGKVLQIPMVETPVHFVSPLHFIILPKRAHMQTMNDLQILGPLPPYSLNPEYPQVRLGSSLFLCIHVHMLHLLDSFP